MSKRSFSRKLHTPALQVSAAIVILAAIAGIAFVSVVYQHQIARALTLATTHQPERYSELYFDDSAHLPLFSLNGKVQHVSFRIVNHEAATTTYHYAVTITTNGVATSLADARVTLADGKTADIPFTYLITTPNTPAQISVQLVGRSEHITFRTKS
ncbi:MAG TPA: hypothetical protein VLF91_00200 [Candidatus Saccharimonadales bacterium]|nr:hypothetical protein [Candidatus Saccharimonadales bacterium]